MIVGIDMGGTHVDGVVIKDGLLIASVKRQVNRADYFASLWHCLEDLLARVDKHEIKRIHLSTTICTNAIVEDQVSEVGMILQTGPGIKWSFDNMGEYIAFISGSVDHRGKLVSDLDLDEIDQTRHNFINSPIDALAIVCKFSTRNPEFEQRIKALFINNYKEITMGHILSGKLNFPRRVQTAYLNAAVSKSFQTFANNIRDALVREEIHAPVYVLKADGGTIDFESAYKKPVETILSGPAASFMGTRALIDDDKTDRVLLDIGGTTTDIFFLVDGVPVFEPLGIEIDGRKTLVRAIFSQSIGVGGDSHVRFEEGELMIGPRRIGPAVAFGGEHITPTDAFVYLGKMESPYPEKCRQAMKKLARENSLDAVSLASNIVTQMCEMIASSIVRILKKLNESPVYTIEELLKDRAIKPSSVEAIGGPAKALSSYLESSLGMPVICPDHYAIANAIGAALAKPTVEINLLADTERRIVSVPELEIYREIDKSFNLQRAEQFALSHVQEAGKTLGLDENQLDAEIVESSSFNMVHGYYGGVDKNIRVKAQIKPGLLGKLTLTNDEKASGER